jgi:hypothetical protein
MLRLILGQQLDEIVTLFSKCYLLLVSSFHKQSYGISYSQVFTAFFLLNCTLSTGTDGD